MQHHDGVTVFVAVVAGLAALTLWSAAEAAEAHIRPFDFGCETPGGRVVEPRHGDIEGVSYTDLPAQRQQCLGTIDRKIALCRENTEFASDARNEELAVCLPIFRKQVRACVGHFSFERSKCGARDARPDDDAAGEQQEEPALEGAPGDRYRVEPADRLMVAAEAANVRTGPSPDYDIVGTVMAGDELQVTGEVRGRDWVRVVFPRGNGRAAFIYAPLLRAVKPTVPTAEPDSVPSTTATTAPFVPSGPSWSIAENQPCHVWNYGNRDYEPFTWSGACLEGKASGEGRLVFRGGEGAYEGTMQAGKMHGRGSLGLGQRFSLRGRTSRRQAARLRNLRRGQRRSLRG